MRGKRSYYGYTLLIPLYSILLIYVNCKLNSITKILYNRFISDWNKEVTPFPIDLVYLWLNSSNVAFVALRNRTAYEENINITKETAEKDIDIGELIYSIRSAEKYIPWIRNIIIISSTPRPIWFNFNHPKLKFVDTASFLPEGRVFFDSARIQRFIPYIPTLSEYYIYACDDYFFGNYIHWTTFFTPSGLPRYRNPDIVRLNDSNLRGVTWQFQGWAIPNVQNSVLFWASELQSILQCRIEINKECRFKNFHVAIPYRKSFNVEANHIFRSNYYNRKMFKSSFRQTEDLNTEVLFANYAILVRNAKYYFINETNYIHANELHKLPSDGKTKIQLFCINTGIDTTYEQKVNVSKWLKIFMPKPSSYEIIQ